MASVVHPRLDAEACVYEADERRRDANVRRSPTVKARCPTNDVEQHAAADDKDGLVTTVNPEIIDRLDNAERLFKVFGNLRCRQANQFDTEVVPFEIADQAVTKELEYTLLDDNEPTF